MHVYNITLISKLERTPRPDAFTPHARACIAPLHPRAPTCAACPNVAGTFVYSSPGMPCQGTCSVMAGMASLHRREQGTPVPRPTPEELSHLNAISSYARAQARGRRNINPAYGHARSILHVTAWRLRHDGAPLRIST